MDSNRHERISNLFLEACDIPGDQRLAFLQEASGGDQDIISEVLELLRHEETDAVIDNPVIEQPWPTMGAQFLEGETHPESIGPYAISGILGEGGMGVVYRARQSNPERDVALKVIRGGVSSGEFRRRFENEARLLGRLRHPGIAQIYEAGVAEGDSGVRPFFAMELVDGIPLSHFAKENDLDDRERLELVAQICDIIQYAHEKKIIHRDLKPGNILVEADRTVKVMDFGVARLSEPDEIDAISMQTHAGQIIGTLPYMSPEQVSGPSQELDSRSDVYALGVIAHELLTGSLPVNVKNLPVPEAIRRIHDEEATTLSDVDKRFRGDITTMVSRAMEKDRERRYGSAAAFGADIRRFLNNEPIVARPATALYQLGKFARRHRAFVVAAAFSLIALLVGAGFAIWQAIVATAAAKDSEKARQEAVVARDEARSVTDFLVSMLTSVDASALGRKVLVTDVLDFARRESEELTDRPLVNATVQMATARAYASLGEHDDAITHFKKSLDLRREHLGPEHDDSILVHALYVKSLLSRARNQEAQREAKQLFELCTKVGGPETLESLHAKKMLGHSFTAGGLIEDGCRLMEEAETDFARVFGKQHPDYVDFLAHRGKAHEAHNEYEKAERCYREAVEIAVKNWGGDSHQIINHKKNLAGLIKFDGRFAEAEDELRSIMDVCHEVHGPENAHTLEAMNELAQVISAQGRNPEAAEILAEAIEHAQKSLGPDHPDTMDLLSTKASTLYLMGKSKESLEVIRSVTDLREQVNGFGGPLLIRDLNMRAAIEADNGYLDTSEDIYRRLLEHRLKYASRSEHSVLQIQLGLANTLRLKGKTNSALEILESSYPKLKEVVGMAHPDTLNTGQILALLYQNTSRYDEAETIYGEIRQGLANIYGPDHTQTLQADHNLAGLLMKKGEYEQALGLMERVVSGFVAGWGFTNSDTQNAFDRLLRCARRIGAHERLDPWLDKLIDHAVHSKDSKKEWRLRADLAQAKLQSGDPEGALEMFEILAEHHEDVDGQSSQQAIQARGSIGLAFAMVELFEDARDCFDPAVRAADSLPTLERSVTLSAIQWLNGAGYWLAGFSEEARNCIEFVIEETSHMTSQQRTAFYQATRGFSRALEDVDLPRDFRKALE